ncbi:MAG: HIT domain-containing protein [Opitutales bacterium]|nr:HIT domain-containing protein [Opitutales bacterium]
MKMLYPFWRMAYVSAKQDGPKWEDPFVEIPRQSDEKKVHLLYRGKTCYIVMNAFPYNAGHVMVIPYRAVPSLVDLTEEERADLMETIALAQKIITETLHPHGFNIGFNIGASAGAGIPKHLHCHVVPRWDGDNNFMPVVSDTRCLSSSMDELWLALKKNTPKHVASAKMAFPQRQAKKAVPEKNASENGVPAIDGVPEKASPACPKCGAQMVLKKAKRGRCAGKTFWSCSQFPKCNGTKPTE